MQLDFSIIRVGMYGLLVSQGLHRKLCYIVHITHFLEQVLFSILVLCLSAARLQHTTHPPNNIGSFYGVYYSPKKHCYLTIH
jgi:hypothetical protein